MNDVLSTTSLSSDSKTYVFIIVSAFIIRLYFSTSQEVYIDVSSACAYWLLIRSTCYSQGLCSAGVLHTTVVIIFVPLILHHDCDYDCDKKIRYNAPP